MGEDVAGQRIVGQVGVYRERTNAVRRERTAAAFGHLLVIIENIDIRADRAKRCSRIDDVKGGVRSTRRVGLEK